MTDTAPNGNSRNVEYPLQTGALNVLDELPKSERRGTRSSPIEDALNEIKEHTEVHGKWVEIASYGNGGAASSQGNELRKRHGFKPSFEGWSFGTARADTTNGDPRVGLFARYDPAAQTPEGKAEQENEVARRRAKAATRKPRQNKRENDKKTPANAETVPPTRH